MRGKQPKPPERHHSNASRVQRGPIVVPGVTSASEDDVGYDSEGEISDLQEEMRRMNLSQPDMRKSADVNQASKARRRRREGILVIMSATLSFGCQSTESIYHSQYV